MAKIEIGGPVNLIWASRLQFLESTMRVLHDYREDFEDKTIVCFTDPGIVSGNTAHPLLRLALSQCNLVLIPVFGNLRRISKKTIENNVYRFFFEKVILIDLFFGKSRSRSPQIYVRQIQRKLGPDYVAILFEILNPLDTKVFQPLKRRRYIGMSHTQGGFLEYRLNSDRSTVVEKNVESIRLDSLSGNIQFRAYLHQPLLERLGLENSKDWNIKSVEAISPSYLESLAPIFPEPNKILDGKKFAVLLSRPSSTQSSDIQCPPDAVKKKMMLDIRSSLKDLGMKPVFIAHPTEKNQISKRFDFVLAPGWKVISKIHYLVLISRAEMVFSFGTQIEEECWLLGKKSIVYRQDWSGSESRFVRQGKSYFCKSAEDLQMLIRELSREGA